MDYYIIISTTVEMMMMIVDGLLLLLVKWQCSLSWIALGVPHLGPADIEGERERVVLPTYFWHVGIRKHGFGAVDGEGKGKPSLTGGKEASENEDGRHEASAR